MCRTNNVNPTRFPVMNHNFYGGSEVEGGEWVPVLLPLGHILPEWGTAVWAGPFHAMVLCPHQIGLFHIEVKRVNHFLLKGCELVRCVQNGSALGVFLLQKALIVLVRLRKMTQVLLDVLFTRPLQVCE